MLTCQKCNSTQETGKFCGVCGGKLESAAGTTHESIQPQQPTQTATNQQQAATTTAGQQQGQQTTETIKNNLSQYGTYFLMLLKNPTKAFNTNEGHFLNGLISLFLYAITLSLSLYFLVNSLYQSTFGDFSAFGGPSSIPFFGMNIRLVFASAVLLTISFASALVMIKAIKSESSAKVLVTQYGGLAIPFLGLNIVAMLAGLAGSVLITVLLLSISTSMLLIFVPILFVYEKASNKNNQGQKVYLSLATLFIIVIVNLIAQIIILSDLLSEIGLENIL